MQSGISASQDLHNAFNTLVSSPTQRALLASIDNESLVPTTTLPLHSSFNTDLAQLQDYISPTKATYILIKVDPDRADADGYVAVTFVPNAAPVRQKMLFAATRLTLVRELGIERFRETIFATEKSELSPEGWAKHEKHTALDAPLTEEEQALGGVKAAEASESQGTGARRGHVSSKVNVPMGDGVLEALQSLNEAKGTLVQLKYALPDETLLLDSTTADVSPSSVGSTISGSEPRYSFYSHPSSMAEAVILFIYTCPSSSKVKERMVYSTAKRWVQIVAERDGGIALTKTLEGSEPEEIVEALSGFGQEEKTETSKASFARPKRPGKR